MKKLLLLFAAMLLPLMASAYDFSDNGIYYNFKGDGSLEVVGSSTTIVDIPSSITIASVKYRVTSIGAYAFNGRSDISYLSIPYSITSIGEFAFMGCGSSIKVNIADPESWCKMQLGNEHASPLSSAGKMLVHDIETTSFEVPSTVTSIGAFTFYQCSCLKSLSIPGTVTSIGSSAFEDCDYLTSLSLGEGLKSIGGSAFEGCKRLANLVLPSTVNSILMNAFKNCVGLTDVYCFAANVPSTDASAFNGVATENVTLHVPDNSVNAYKSSWPWSSFKGLTPSQPQQQDDGILYKVKGDGTLEVTGLASWTNRADIPSSVVINGTKYSVTSIGAYAFNGRSDLTYLSIPYSIKSIGEFAFMGCGSSITVNIADPESWCKMQLGNEHASPLSSAGKMLVYDIETTSFEVPSTVTSIGAFTFYQCSCLKSLSIPGTVTSIGSSAFEDCDYLTSVVLSEGLQSIGGSAFEGCKRLPSLVLPSTVNTILMNAFKNCQALTDVYCFAANVPNTDASAFNGVPAEKATLHVPDNAVNAYRSSWPWNTFGIIMAIGGSTPDVTEFTVNGITYKEVTSDMAQVVGSSLSTSVLSIPELVTNNGASYLVTSIGDGAFQNNSMIKYVEMPNSITSIGQYAFGGCSNLESIIIPNSVTEIGDAAFYGCTSMESINLPDNITRIGNNLFWGCARLTDVTIPTSVTTIGKEAFRECLTLASIMIPSYVEEIGENAFQSCLKLKDVYCYTEIIPSTDNSTFDGTPIESATLHVLANIVEAYKAVLPWRSFKEIVALTEEEITGIMAVKQSNDRKGEYYDLTGRRVYNLQKGLYIRNGKKIIVK